MFSTRRDFLHRVSSVGVMVAFAAVASGQEQDKPKADPIGWITLQYRVALDAYAPSGFVAVSNGGMSPPLELVWDLPKADEKGEREAQQKQKTNFDELIESLEAKQINGVEFACKGEWVQGGAKLRITTVPEPTEAGIRRIKESGG